ncbi:lipoprotein-releasing ABC transporter permease subunit [Parazoarcus communis]|uniref:Lipoprotein-releasing ABC transporter permease subunit n=1 Tax=Parazoarcus communis SWub3 = DSM 12120 TaxID=1121029 RepID=A0A323USA3_9RHOO|nr:lipoprotein-releasing ABC transporter permease subunit [Parazoarcus communis]NMG70986.1 lipoprotein-releasing ABC transporter permease subunit [Parazoarcus communis SWub3 = DSM 12120]PZA15414.1 lipoprotein-releasing ABC transporter permease subunit [Azoarcus communis] [Parazoarcus communis SWub3 = DSM 12120]
MRYEFLVGLRYTRSRKRAQGRNRFISFISLVSMLGIALGVAALIVVLSVMNGFQEELRTRILGVASHVQVQAFDSELRSWQQVAEQASRHPSVKAAAPYVQEQGMLSFDEAVRGTMVRGVIPALEETVADFAQHMKAGRFDALQAGRFGIVLGRDLALALRVGMGDKVTLIAPQGLVTPAAVLPRVKQFEVVGIFEAGMYEYDSGLALIHIADAQALYRMGDGVSGVRLKLDDLFAAPRVARELIRYIEEPGLGISDWTRSHANFFRAVALEKTMMTLILFLIVGVAAFNIVSTLVMAVQEKYADIAILRTLGASPGSIMTIFVLQGSIIGLVGLLAGLGGGLAIAHNLDVVIPALETLTGATLWNKEIYYINELPSKVLASDVVTILSVSFVLTLVAALYPSWRASKVNPAEALRYE